MLWIVALAAAAVIGSIARNAWQDHRDAELQRRDALDDVARPRTWRKQRALPTGERLRLSAGSESEQSREAGQGGQAGETRTSEAPAPLKAPAAAPPVAPAAAAVPRAASEPRKPTPPLGARML